MELLAMYNGLINSPTTTITASIIGTDTVINIEDIDAIPSSPNLLVIGGDTDNPETVKLISVNGTALTVERGFQGIVKAWGTGTKISRNFTEYDYAALKWNVEAIGAKDTGSDIQARREIMDIKLKLDEMEVIDYLNKTGIGYFNLFKSSDLADISFEDTTIIIDAQEGGIVFENSKIITMKPVTFDNFNNIELAIYDKERDNIKPDGNVNNGTQIQSTILPNAVVAGDKFYYNGNEYTVTGVQET